MQPAYSAKKEGAESVLLIEREKRLGGILNQCIHDGFGLVRYHEMLTGPEYAALAEKEAVAVDIDIMTDTMVVDVTEDLMVSAINRSGFHLYEARSIVLATGCRERTRGAISIPGTRPAGVFTAGVAQNLINIRNIMIGKRVIILGSGDIGLIMARRLTLEGAKVIEVLEVMPDSGGLQRNIRQCLDDFGIPLYTQHTVTKIFGEKKITAVECCAVDENGQAIADTARIVECDALVLSVGLIPENELAKSAGVKLDMRSNGTMTDEYLQTNIAGIFSCGNSHVVMDLADFVSEQGLVAGANAAAFCFGKPMTSWKTNLHITPAKGIPAPNTVICPLCPNGCCIDEVEGVFTGNACHRGEDYAKQESIAPMRTLTTTLRTDDGRLISVKTDKPVSKEQIRTLSVELQKRSVPNKNYSIGDVLIADYFGVNIVATTNSRQ